MLLPALEWVVAAFILSPIISFIITMASIIISSKSTDIRFAQGIGSVVIFPIYTIIGFQFTGFFILNIAYLLIGCLVLINFLNYSNLICKIILLCSKISKSEILSPSLNSAKCNLTWNRSLPLFIASCSCILRSSELQIILPSP